MRVQKPIGRLARRWTLACGGCYLIGMTWTELLVVVLRGALQFYVDVYCSPEARRRARKRKAPPPKAAPPTPKAEEPMHSAGWGPPKEASLVNLITLETDTGLTVAAASFIGEESFGVTKVQRERQAGESRRTRRKTQPVEPVPAADATPLVDPAEHDQRTRFFAQARERMRQWGNMEHALKQAEAQRQAEEAEAAAQREAPSTVHPPIPAEPARTRLAGQPPLVISWITLETLLLLELGEPLTYVYATTDGGRRQEGGQAAVG